MLKSLRVKMASFNEIKLKIDSGEFTVVQRLSKSQVFNIFYDIKDSNGEILKNVLLCTRCKNLYTANANCTSNLLRHHCYKKYKASKQEHMVKLQPTDDLKTKCMELVVQWVIGNCRPCNIVNDKGLYKLAEFLIKTGHMFGHNLDVKRLIPHSSTVARDIASLYDERHAALKEELHSIKNIGFSITCELWSDNCVQTSYIGATAHYIKDGSIAHKILGLHEMVSDRNSGCNIRNKIVNILRGFDCELNQMITVVTDRESNMKEIFQHDRSIICINLLISNVLEAAVSDTSEVNMITNACSKLVKYFKKSGVNSVLNTALECFPTTRWNRIFYLLKSVQQNWDDITQTLQEKNMTSRLANLNLSDINGILEVLSPFEEASRLLGGENYPTLHHVIPQMRKLRTMSSKNYPNETEMIAKLKERLLFHMETVIDPNIKDLHKIALFLFPPANKLQNFSENEKGSIHGKCKEMLIAYENYRPNCDILVETVDADADAFNDFVQFSASPDFQDEISIEMFRYERQTVLYYKQFDPIAWWETHNREYPLLHRLCYFVLATPASSAVSKRLFSKASHLLSESEFERKPIGVNQIMFLHSNADLKAPRANQVCEFESKMQDSDSDTGHLKCSTPTIKKCSSPTPD